MNHIELVNRIDILLNESGSTRAKLLKETELAESTIRSWRRGALPGAENLYKVAKFLNTTVEYLLTGEGESQTSSNSVLLIKEAEKPYLNKSEEELLTIYRELPANNQFLMLTLARQLNDKK